MSYIDFDRRPILHLEKLCIPVSSLPSKLCFTLPGGIELCVSHARTNIGVLEYAQAALQFANAAIAPIKPVLDLVDLVMSIIEVLYAVPDVVTNPGKILELLEKVKEKAIIVAKLIPPVSVFILALQLLDALIMTVEGFATEFESLYYFAQRIESAQLSAIRAPGLEELIKCSESTLNVQMENLSKLFASLNAIIEVVNFIGVLAKAKGFPIPAFGDSVGGSYGELPGDPKLAAASLRELGKVLTAIRSAIPI